MIKQKRNTYNNQQSGFTLIELAILMTIVSLMVAAALDNFNAYKTQKAISDTTVKQILVSNSMAAFVGHNGYLPCPADPSLAPNDPLAGVAQCIHEGGAPTAVGSCSGAICRTEGHRIPLSIDADGDGLRDNILIGALPYVTLGITHQDTIDGWGGSLTYAMSEAMSDPAQYTDTGGVINKQSYDPGTATITNDFNPAVVPPTGTIGAFMIAIVSHGSDGKGAYNYDGNLIAPCVGTDRDTENCDNDKDFISADSDTMVHSRGDNTEYFDDAFTTFTLSRDVDKWAYTSGSTVRNKTGGNVGIGTNLPTEPLHIDGNLKAEDILSDKICDADYPTRCFNPDLIGGSGSSCGDGLLIGVRLGKLMCLEKIDPSLIVPKDCGQGYYITGIDAGGNPICDG